MSQQIIEQRGDERMTEYEAVLCLILNVPKPEPAWEPDLEDPQYQRATRALDALLDVHAHELADEQRAMAEHHGVRLDGGEVSVGDIIDHIDPHVGTVPVRPDEEPGAGSGA